MFLSGNGHQRPVCVARKQSTELTVGGSGGDKKNKVPNGKK
jgi:hypothetical protein